MSLAVVGTDTGVGKTVVTAGITRWLRERGVDAVAVKPCQTGYPKDDDAGFVREVCAADEAATCLRTLGPALAPAVAAELEGVDLSYTSIHRECEALLTEREYCVVEGVGGLRVPLADGHDVIDLVADLELPALVVGRSGLGTLNHTALSVEALERRGIAVVGVVLDELDGETVAERTNPGVVENENEVPVGTLPTADTPRLAAERVRRSLRDTLGRLDVPFPT